MTRRCTYFCMVLALVLSVWPLGKGDADAVPERRLPNIVMILADDLGYGDVRAFNPDSRIPTPHLDRIAEQGMRFTDAHSGSSVCTPTRYGILTGRYCWRTRLKSGVLSGYSSPLIEPERPTVASFLKRNGYDTACVGKWHLGMRLPFIEEEGSASSNRAVRAKAAREGRYAEAFSPIDYGDRIENGPQVNGFDYNYNVIASLDMPPYVYVENDRFVEAATEAVERRAFPEFWRAGPMAPGFKFEECLDHLTDKAVQYIAERANAGPAGGRPFFLYFPLTAPHKPVTPVKDLQGKSKLGPYGDFIMQVDRTVGRIDNALHEAGVAENTLLIVTSDNGSFMFRLENVPANMRRAGGEDHVTRPATQAYDSKHHQSNHIWRGTKADIWDGGHRVPFIARWPGRVEAGTTCDTPICHTDFMATCADVIGAALPDDAAEDSFSLLQLLLGQEPAQKRSPVVHHSANGTFALRDGPWKMIFGSGSGGRGQPKSKPWTEPYQLYNMHDDPSETTNLIDNPDCAPVVRRLTQWAEKLGIVNQKLVLGE
jgi:arylsulfatase A